MDLLVLTYKKNNYSKISEDLGLWNTVHLNWVKLLDYELICSVGLQATHRHQPSFHLSICGVAIHIVCLIVNIQII